MLLGGRDMRQVIVRLHRWIGIVLAAYVAMICLTGSALVYRPELYRYFEPRPVAVTPGSTLLSDEELLERARRAFPAEEPAKVWRGEPGHAVEVDLVREGGTRGYLFDPYSGRPLRPTLPLGYTMTTKLLQLHTELLGGPEGRLVNGAFALGFIFLGLTGILAWTPRKRRRAQPSAAASLAGRLRRLHKSIGIWVSAFVLLWGLTGLHLAYPGIMSELVDYFDPFDEMNPVERVGDHISYWLAYLHFGRFGGRVPGCDRGICDEAFKAIWALMALAPVFLVGTGLFLWLRGLRARARVRRSLAPGQDSADRD